MQPVQAPVKSVLLTYGYRGLARRQARRRGGSASSSATASQELGTAHRSTATSTGQTRHRLPSTMGAGWTTRLSQPTITSICASFQPICGRRARPPG
jgi:hypothetical protein